MSIPMNLDDGDMSQFLENVDLCDELPINVGRDFGDFLLAYDSEDDISENKIEFFESHIILIIDSIFK